MPSPLDLLSDGKAVAPPGPPPEDVLHAVKADGGRRRAVRHRRNLALAVLGLALVTIPTATLRPDASSPGEEINVAADGRTELVPDVSEPTPLDPVAPDLVPGDPAGTTVPTLPAVAATEATVPSPPTTQAVVPSTAPPSTRATTTAAPPTTRSCRNSDDPACGTFRWDPAPGPNQPLVASFSKAPATAVAGQPVTFEVTWSDGDAGLTFDRFSFDGTGLASACSLPPRHGPWSPPAVVPSSGTLPYTQTFAPGTYTIRVELGTAGCDSPYGSETAITTTLTVTAAAG